MNIFILDSDFKINAQYHNNKHCVKMIVETAQLLSTAHRELDSDVPDELYKSTHKNHPCSIWTREIDENYNWLYKLFVELLAEYTYRYSKVHKCEGMLPLLQDPPKNIKHGYKTEHPLCMPDQYKIQNNVIDSYRQYYIGDKQHIAQWKNRDVPYWWKYKPLDQPNI